MNKVFFFLQVPKILKLSNDGTDVKAAEKVIRTNVSENSWVSFIFYLFVN